MFELDWSRPSALLALALPLALWVLARRPRPPRELATGTLAIWRELRPTGEPVGAARRRGVPWWVRFTMAALVCGALALAGPTPRPAEEERWIVVVDQRPGVFLPWVASDGRADERTRLDVALDRALALQLDPAEREWRRYVDGAWERATGAAPPDAWRVAPARPAVAPPWSEVDARGTLFVSDRRVDATLASPVWSGGGAVEGLVGRRGDRALYWRGGALAAGESLPPLRVAIDPEVPRELATLTAAWARERGAEIVAEDADLAVRAAPGGDGDDGEDSQDSKGSTGDAVRVRGASGWSWRGAARDLAVPGDARVLRRDERGAPRLVGTAGDLLLGLGEPFALDGDRRAAGLAWIAHLEDAVPPPAGAVALAARADAGEGGAVIGPDPAGRSAPRPGAPFAFWLTLGALACAAAAARAGAALRV